jgi:hypothetical protein
MSSVSRRMLLMGIGAVALAPVLPKALVPTPPVLPAIADFDTGWLLKSTTDAWGNTFSEYTRNARINGREIYAAVDGYLKELDENVLDNEWVIYLEGLNA